MKTRQRESSRRFSELAIATALMINRIFSIPLRSKFTVKKHATNCKRRFGWINPTKYL
ncbi:hypothetical protein A6A12_1250 [Vibrio anguillarum]|nr:hypothetical protein A6A12_1250 [Vibrio anguillarum]